MLCSRSARASGPSRPLLLRYELGGAGLRLPVDWLVGPESSHEAVQHVGHLSGGPRSEIASADVEVQPEDRL
jgi:hypothetical protein